MLSKVDVIVIGGGIAGVSAAAEIAASARVILFEMESQPGYHATGRSAAFFAAAYGTYPNLTAMPAGTYQLFNQIVLEGRYSPV